MLKYLFFILLVLLCMYGKSQELENKRKKVVSGILAKIEGKYFIDKDELLVLSEIIPFLKEQEIKNIENSICNILSHKKKELYPFALEVLSAMGDKAQSAVKNVCDILQEDDVDKKTLKYSAIYFRKLGKSARGAAPILIKLLKKKPLKVDPHDMTYYMVVRALGEIGSEEIAPDLLNIVLTRQELAVEAAISLGKLGVNTINQIRTALEHRDPDIRICGVLSLQVLVQNNLSREDLIHLLCQSYYDKNSRVRIVVLNSLIQIKLQNTIIASIVEKALDDIDPHVQLEACSLVLIAKFKKKEKKAKGILLKHIWSKNTFLRMEAQRILRGAFER